MSLPFYLDLSGLCAIFLDFVGFGFSMLLRWLERGLVVCVCLAEVIFWREFAVAVSRFGRTLQATGWRVVAGSSRCCSRWREESADGAGQGFASFVG